MSKAGITTYVVVNDRDEYVTSEMDSYKEAKAAAEAMAERTAVVEMTYEFADSELVWTSTGANTWPPTLPEEQRDRVNEEKRS